MAKSAWKKFPYSDKAYDYAGPALKKAWSALHRGDCEPFPDEAWVKKAIEAHPKLDPKMPPAKAAEEHTPARPNPSAPTSAPAILKLTIVSSLNVVPSGLRDHSMSDSTASETARGLAICQ